MKARTLITLLKTCLFIGLSLFIGNVYAEFYLVYSMPANGPDCGYRTRTHHYRSTRIRTSHRRIKHHYHHYRYAQRVEYQRTPTGLYIMFPAPGGPFPCPDVWPLGNCNNCCTSADWQPGNYAVYTLPPNGIESTYPPNGDLITSEPSYNPDFSTRDDYSIDHPGMYVN